MYPPVTGVPSTPTTPAPDLSPPGLIDPLRDGAALTLPVPPLDLPPSQAASDPTLRLYAIVRADLAMPPGKLASQSGHAFLDAYLDACTRTPAIAAQYRDGSHGTKVVLEARSLEHLLAAHMQCLAAGLPCALITDRDHVLLPHFTGAPIVTALGIGPALRHDVRAITKRFRSAR